MADAARSRVKDGATALPMRYVLRYLLRPYRPLLLVVLMAMIVETAASLADPWPLKVVLDNVVGTHHLPAWMARVITGLFGSTDPARIAVAAGLGFIVITAIGGAASYVDNYVTEIVAQHVAHNMRLRVYDHLQRLSLSFYDKHQVGALISTLTTDIGTIQDFASSDVLTILVDVFTVVGMLALMFWLRWDFALIATLVAPFRQAHCAWPARHPGRARGDRAAGIAGASSGRGVRGGRSRGGASPQSEPGHG
jgi:ABC-type multidrug transport system fused ATPase/permease subunit